MIIRPEPPLLMIRCHFLFAPAQRARSPAADPAPPRDVPLAGVGFDHTSGHVDHKVQPRDSRLCRRPRRTKASAAADLVQDFDRSDFMRVAFALLPE